MNFVKTIFKWLICIVLTSLFINFFKFLIQVIIIFSKTLWITIKYTFRFLVWLIYISTRLITWPFRKCFPPKTLDQMSGIDFERFAAKWLSLQGYRGIKVTQATADYGVDIIAHKDGIVIGVQCKRYSGKVGISAVQEITAGLPFYNCEKGIVLTNSEFTQNAIDLALTNGIELIDGNTLKSTRAAKSLLKSNFSIIISVLIISIFTVIICCLNFWVIFRARSFLPLTLMLLSICLLCLINGIFELKNRKNRNLYIEEDEEYNEDQNTQIPDFY